jgi:hypothetical protein
MFRRSMLIVNSWPLVLLLSAAAPISAQDEHRSHVPVPLPADVDPARLFEKRIQQARLPADIADLVKQFGANRPANEEQLRKIFQDNPQLRDMLNNPESRDQFRDLLGKAIQQQLGRAPPGMTPDALLRELESLRLSPPAGGPPMPTPRPIDRPPLDPTEQARKRELANQMAKWAEKFPRDKLPDSVRNSPTVKDLFNRLSESAADALRNPSGDGLDALARLESRLQAIRDWLPKEMPAALQSLKLPDLSRYAPNMRIPRFEMNAPTLPSAPRFGPPDVEARSAATALLAGIGAAIVIVTIWRLFGGRLSPAVGGLQPLGPWPLDPAQVANRAELIQAFEYLSLLRCGEPARTWNHRAIADRLGGTESDRRMAADQLAELYEQARYAPTASGEPDWSAARGPLSLLAGAG